jgi:hypothetical protein
MMKGDCNAKEYSAPLNPYYMTTLEHKHHMQVLKEENNIGDHRTNLSKMFISWMYDHREETDEKIDIMINSYYLIDNVLAMAQGISD